MRDKTIMRMQNFSSEDKKSEKISFKGTVNSVQPRIRLLRSFDQRSHSYLGYALLVNGTIGNEQREFLIGIGKGAQSKLLFRAGDVISGECQTVENTRQETVEFYKTSKPRLLQRPQVTEEKAPPWLGFRRIWKHTASVDIEGLISRLMTPNAQLVYGVAIWLLK